MGWVKVGEGNFQFHDLTQDSQDFASEELEQSLTQTIVEKETDEDISFVGDKTSFIQMTQDLYESCDTGDMHATPPKVSRTKDPGTVFTEVKIEPGTRKVTPPQPHAAKRPSQSQQDAKRSGSCKHKKTKLKYSKLLDPSFEVDDPIRIRTKNVFDEEEPDPYKSLGTPPYSKCRSLRETIRDGVLVTKEALGLEDPSRIRNKNIEFACMLQDFVHRYHKMETIYKKHFPGYVLDDKQQFITAVMDIRDQVLAVRFRVDVLSTDGFKLAFRAANVEGTAGFLGELIKKRNHGYLLKCYKVKEETGEGKLFHIYPVWNTH